MSDDTKLRQRAVSLLARRDHSRRELGAKLRRKRGKDGDDVQPLPEAIDGVLDHMESLGYLNDERFTEMFVRSRCEQGYGPLRIRAELIQRGVPSEAVAAALRERDEEWHAIARRIWQRRFSIEAEVSPKELAKRLRFMAQRGFTADHVRYASGVDLSEFD